MAKDRTTIECPSCGTDIDVNDILYQQVDEQLKTKYQADLAREKKRFASLQSDLDAEKAALEQAREEQTEKLEAMLRDRLRQKEAELTKRVKDAAESEQKDALDMLRTELEDKSKKLKDLNRSKAELEKIKREKNELAETLRAEAEKQLNERIAAERERISREESGKTELKMKELQKQLEDQKKLTAEMKRKQEQGSVQMQGEVQELVIEEWLAAQFPLDVIQEIKKGERGGDCLQIVHTRNRQNCGSIYYESKRTKHFQPSWLEKFKLDIQDKNADIGVLVTQVMPADMPRMGLRDGVWVCSFEEFKGLSAVLRESVVRISRALVTQENRGDKMGLLYDYLTSNEFRLQIESIVEGFTQMKSDLEREQRSMRANWKKREKQIEKVLLNTTGMYGSIKGIAGNAIQDIGMLELDEDQQSDLLDHSR